MPGAAAELAVGDPLEAEFGLHLDRLFDAIVLAAAQGLGGDPAALVFGPGGQQGLWPQQAADMIGAERRGLRRHGPALPAARAVAAGRVARSEKASGSHGLSGQCHSRSSPRVNTRNMRQGTPSCSCSQSSIMPASNSPEMMSLNGCTQV